MISVLIPIYNFNVLPLIANIHQQLLNSSVVFEIICIDDASTEFESKNNEITELSNVILIKLEKNIGRSKIRNLLASKANYSWLLFLDSDVFPKNNNFIQKYLQAIKLKDFQVFCGGISYKKEAPESTKMLRWKYGKNREEINFKKREENPYKYFFGANFLINKSVFNEIKFNENIIKYGYEDVLFVENLRLKFIKIKHINSTIFHLGIETNSEFLNKTKEALANLQTLNLQNGIDGKFIKILNAYKIVKLFGLISFFSLNYKVFHKILEINLKGKTPSMFVFDIYKLIFFCYLTKSNI